MQKHTEGPFSIGQDATDLVDKDCRSTNSRFVAIDAPGHGALAIVVVRMEEDEADNPRLLGNLALFAAAADLLAALEEARNGLIWYHETHPMMINDSDHEAMARIDAAILKATGGAS